MMLVIVASKAQQSPWRDQTRCLTDLLPKVLPKELPIRRVLSYALVGSPDAAVFGLVENLMIEKFSVAVYGHS